MTKKKARAQRLSDKIGVNYRFAKDLITVNSEARLYWGEEVNGKVQASIGIASRKEQ
jgi:hypothetical protein